MSLAFRLELKDHPAYRAGVIASFIATTWGLTGLAGVAWNAARRPMTSETMIRRAVCDDIAPLAETAAAAFADYPWTRWVVDADDHVERLRALYAIHLDVALRFGEVWMADDASGFAAWTWSEAEQRQAAYLAEAGLLEPLATLAGARAENATRADGLLGPHVPAEPHWCLAAVAVRPDAQRRGLATRLLAPVLARCDAEGRLARLETSSPDNLRLYGRLGFRTRAEVAVPDGPPVWLMFREPAVDAHESGCHLRDLA